MGMAGSEMAKSLKTIHQGVLISVAIALGIVSGKAWLFSVVPTTGTPTINTTLKVLNQWQEISQHSLQEKDWTKVVPGTFQGGSSQTWQQNAVTVTVQQAVVTHSDGDLKRYLKTYSNDLSSVIRHDEKLGHYALLFQGDRLTMMGCITASQQVTVTADQYKVAQIKASFRPAQLWAWLSNREQLVPHTCQWRSLSITPITPDSTAILLDLWPRLD